MNYKPTARRDDLPPTDSEIELSPGTLAQSPRRVKNRDAVAPLREVRDQVKQLESELTERQSRLEAARAAAIVIQDEYEALLNDRVRLKAQIDSAEWGLKSAKTRRAELEDFVRRNWETLSTHEHVTELLRHEFMLKKLPRWLAEFQSALVVLNEKIVVFERQYGVGVGTNQS
jgi:chromosome segregation ATPase